ncbi:MAG: acyl-CoA thioesterase [Gammaproteobacteria bacterium]|jgi:acyl-CoA thioester hydrolase|nr:acyl-CoA thioesterase [Gammaproteobacteria bacterium]MCP4880789.1 acyl-CoA thioesterase [Gammaproteobacteria bacterium]MDP6165614.1 thioesterase family protein [Gammaproteobacteria bacterium]
MSHNSPLPVYDDFPLQSYDKLRYPDTDRQGHVNNSLFSTFLETGRVELMSHPDSLLTCDGCTFVIASQNLDLLGEINWPGTVETGTKVLKVGNSSTTLYQAIYHLGKCVAVAETVIVQMHEATRKSHPLSNYAKDVLSQYVEAE